MKRGWTKRRDVTIPPHVPYESDEWIWREYSLFLLINRHCGEYLTDDEVSEALWKVRQRIPLPFEDRKEVPNDDPPETL